MLLTVPKLQNKQLKRFLEHSVYLLIVFVLVPGFIYFELCVVLPSVVEIWSICYIIHYVCATFLLINIIGNMIYGMFTDTSIRGKILESEHKEDWTMCTICECLRPPRAWHCDTCDTCILKRDHHCTFFACCIGYYNHRYFMFFTLYIFIAMVYSFYYNVIFLSNFIKWNHGLIIAQFVFPLATFVIDFGEQTLYVFLVEINFIIGAFTGFLFIFHFNNILKGKITPETKPNVKGASYDKGLKLNLIEVFGYRWYLSWISPFIKSPLPGNGVEWIVEDKHK
ncbi:probable palmitoyltransferase ZDHHC24 [Vanessa tameamea]|uniref:Palmitoyltransferase n=1 Tax=Vanessa tameamea TaxID=334116 RepID=A0A8B8HUK8_VANTA|nr:probable palmitoyltransferase ZDHHC24 [Vanessa tameamea]